MGGKGGHRVVTPIPDQVFGKLALFLGYGSVTLHHFRVDDGHVQAGLDAVVKEDRIEHLASGRWQAEGDVGNAQNRLRVWQGLLDQTHPFDGLRRRTNVVHVARAGGENQRVEYQVFFRDAVLFCQQFVRTLGNFQLAFSGDGLRLVIVVVDAAHHQRGAVCPGQRGHSLEAGLPILQVHRIDDGLALQPLQRFFNDGGVSGVNHYGTLDLLGDQIQELDNVCHLVPVRVLQTNVQHMGSVTYLTAPHFSGFFEGSAADQAAESAAAQHVCAFAHDGRPGVFINHEGLNARNPGLMGFHRCSWGGVLRPLCQQANVLRPRAAATANNIEPAVFQEATNGCGQHFGCLIVFAVLVGQAGVGQAGHREAGKARQGTNVVCHKVRARGAVEPDPQQVAVC